MGALGAVNGVGKAILPPTDQKADREQAAGIMGGV